MPLPKMLPLLTDEAAESWELRPGPAPGLPPHLLGPQRGLPNAAAPRGARSLTHGPGDGGRAPGSPPRHGGDFQKPPNFGDSQNLPNLLMARGLGDRPHPVPRSTYL